MGVISDAIDALEDWSYPTKGTTLFIIYLHSKIKTNRQA